MMFSNLYKVGFLCLENRAGENNFSFFFIVVQYKCLVQILFQAHYIFMLHICIIPYTHLQNRSV